MPQVLSTNGAAYGSLGRRPRSNPQAKPGAAPQAGMERTFGAQTRACLLSLILLICFPFIAWAADLTTAQDLLLKGRYEEARELFDRSTRVD